MNQVHEAVSPDTPLPSPLKPLEIPIRYKLDKQDLARQLISLGCELGGFKPFPLEPAAEEKKGTSMPGGI